MKTTRDGSTWDETQWTYDEASGVQTAKTYADGSVVRHDYDEDGRPTRTTWARGAWFENRYDEWGQVVAVAHDDPTIDAAMSYDVFGRLVTSSNNAAAYRYTYDDRDLITNEFAAIDGITNVIVRDFDDYGRPSRLRIADSDYDQTYAYDDAGRLSVIGIPGSTVSYAYTPDSLDAGYSVLTPSNAILTRALTRDPLRRGLITVVSNYVTRVDGDPENLSPLPSNLLPPSFVYTYDVLGRPVTRNLDEFGYNARGEVAWARYGTNSLADLYGYDDIGNFTSNRLRGVWSQFEANELNQYTAIADDNPHSLAYDLDGNLLTNGVWSYTYDAHNQMSIFYSNTVAVARNLYDPFHRRVFNRGQFKECSCLYDEWNLIRETIEDQTAEYTRENYWGIDARESLHGTGGVGGLLFVAQEQMEAFPFFDHLGNVCSYANAIGQLIKTYTYDAFGKTQAAMETTNEDFPIRFSTKQLEWDLYYYGFRHYSPREGRWLSRDPIEEKGSINLYVVMNNASVSVFDNLGQIVAVHHYPDQCKIILAINISIYYANELEKNARTDLARIAKRIKKSIESHWNSASWSLGCCAVEFQANVKPFYTTDEAQVVGDNKIKITTDSKHRSYVDVVGGPTGYWAADNVPGSDWTFAHEAGHLMGLPDDYVDNARGQSIPNAGHAGHMMGQYGGSVDPHEVSDILSVNSVECECLGVSQ